MQLLKNHQTNQFLRIVLAVLLAVAIVTASGVQQGLVSYAEEQSGQNTEEILLPEDSGEGYIIKLKEDRTAAEEETLAETVEQEEGLTALSCTEDVLTAEDAEAVQEVDAEVIEYVEANHPVELSAVRENAPYNDPYYTEQYYLDRIHVPAAWLTEEEMERVTGANPPVVAVIDSGLYSGHEDIDAARILPGRYFGKDEVSDDTNDYIGHGTQVTGILMATCNNGAGIAGLTQGIRVMPLRVVDEDGACTEKQVIEAIHYAAEQKRAYNQDPSQGTNIQVINMSLEVVLQESEPSPRALYEACQEAMEEGILIVCAGGNGGGSAATYPAQYTLGVGATGYEESTGDVHAADSRLLCASNGEGYENKIWVCAPGVDLTAPSCGGTDSYTVVSGTSFAAPQVAALAAYCKWIDPSLDQDSFKALLSENARFLDGADGRIGSQDAEYGYGIVDYEKVLQALAAQNGAAFAAENSGEAADSSGEEDSEAAVTGSGTGDDPEEAVVSAAAEVYGDPEDPLNPVNDNSREKQTSAEPESAEAEAGDAQLQASPYFLGIDVSYWNGESIDWTKVRNAGVRFVIVRVGYAGLGSGKLNEDYMYASNIKGAFDAGINVGVYFYSQATTPAEARAEANYMISKIEPYRNYITLPLVMDMESPETFNGSLTYWAKASVTKARVAANYLAFADTVNTAGYVPMFYTYTYWITENLGNSMGAISNTGYPFWLAEYTTASQPPQFTRLYGAVHKYEFWQYSASSRISGISTDVDCNRWYTSDLFKYDRRGHWVKDEIGWRYYNYEDELVTSGWAHDRKGLAWLNADGYWEERTGWVDDHGERYYIKDGYRQSNIWLKDRSGWCYAGSDGRLVKNGWAKDRTGWVYLNANGYWVNRTGWIQVNGEWYYLKAGYRQDNTWLRDSVGWCWLNQNGYWVKKRWIQYRGEWYYLKANGYMAANEWARDSRGWMWMNGSGKITKSRWIKYKGYWYSLKANGYMATGQQTINGKVYRFYSSGKWIE